MVLGIYGAGGLGRELYVLANQINKIENRWNEIICIDDTEGISDINGKRPSTFNETILKYNNKNLEFVIAVGEPHSRNLLREKVNKLDFSLAILVHPSVSISDETKLGAGTVICCNCFISCNVIIKENVLVQPSVSIGHDNIIGNDTVISTNVCIAGGCNIGNETYIGIQVPIKEGINIGNQTIIGMGSVVIRDIPDQVIAMGNPARAMKNNVDHKVFHK
jgi:sugar O-acyltransferase (sialic acid O-acetyltransferase NeuD family)